MASGLGVRTPPPPSQQPGLYTVMLGRASAERREGQAVSCSGPKNQFTPSLSKCQSNPYYEGVVSSITITLGRNNGCICFPYRHTGRFGKGTECGLQVPFKNCFPSNKWAVKGLSRSGRTKIATLHESSSKNRAKAVTQGRLLYKCVPVPSVNIP